MDQFQCYSSLKTLEWAWVIKMSDGWYVVPSLVRCKYLPALIEMLLVQH